MGQKIIDLVVFRKKLLKFLQGVQGVRQFMYLVGLKGLSIFRKWFCAVAEPGLEQEEQYVCW